jgi:hypothetical protein
MGILKQQTLIRKELADAPKRDLLR